MIVATVCDGRPSSIEAVAPKDVGVSGQRCSDTSDHRVNLSTIAQARLEAALIGGGGYAEAGCTHAAKERLMSAAPSINGTRVARGRLYV